MATVLEGTHEYYECTEYSADEYEEEDSTEVSTPHQDLEEGIDPAKISENIGIQFMFAIVTLGIVYGLGNYFFKTLPSSMLQKRIDNL